MKRFLLAATVAGAVLAGASAQAATYLAYNDFKVVGGAIPASNFKYGRTSGAFTGDVTAFSTLQSACNADAQITCGRDGEVSISKAGTYDAPGTPFYVDGFLNLHADAYGNMPVVQFTAPVAGDYTFTGRFEAHDVSPNGVDLMAYVGTTSEFSAFMLGQPYDFDFAKTLGAGDKVSFVMGTGGNWTYDSTGFKLSVGGPDLVSGVPEPATWATMILGAGLAGSALRRARRRRQTFA